MWIATRGLFAYKEFQSTQGDFSKVEDSYLHIRNFSHLTISELNSVKTLSLMTNSLVVLIPTNRRQISYLTFLDTPPPHLANYKTHMLANVFFFPDSFKSFLLGHWYPFWTSRDICHGFQASVDPSLAYFIVFMQWILLIHWFINF